MSSYEEDEESFEHTLLLVREVSVYKIPPRTSSGGYKCGEWLQSDKIWSGRFRVVSCKERCEIRLEDPNSGDLFAACFVYPGRRDSSVETVLDSSRYFVLKIEDGQGKHAFVGLGFNERNEAFDFNVALSDHDKYVKRGDHDKDATNKNTNNINGDAISSDTDTHIDIHPAVNHRLKEGETIRINVKHKPATSGTGMLSAAAAGKSRAVLGIAPPPTGAGKIRTPLPPPPNDTAVARISASGSQRDGGGVTSRDALSDLSPLERNLPSATTAVSTQKTSSGWAAF